MSRKLAGREAGHRGFRGNLIGWEKYLDGDKHLLIQGEDFAGHSVSSTRSAGQQWAKRNGMRAQCFLVTEGKGGSFTFQILEGLDDELKRLAAEVQAIDELDKPSDGDRYRRDELMRQARHHLLVRAGKSDGKFKPRSVPKAVVAEEKERQARYDPVRERYTRVAAAVKAGMKPDELVSDQKPGRRRRT